MEQLHSLSCFFSKKLGIFIPLEIISYYCTKKLEFTYNLNIFIVKFKWTFLTAIEDSHNLSLYINDAVYTSGNNVHIR